MHKISIVLFAAAALVASSGCASTKAEKPAVCDGKHRRPANLYGSVLPTIPLPGSPAGSPLAAPNANSPPPPPSTPGPLSRLDQKSFEPCRRAA